MPAKTDPRPATGPGTRRLPIGVELDGQGAGHARVWAPARRSVAVEIVAGDGSVERTIPLEGEDHGYFSGFIANVEAGTRYRYRLDDRGSFPDPASRAQPDGPHGPSQMVDPRAYQWRDAAWKGVRLPGQVIYELHVGTFTPGGTFRAAVERFEQLAELGITVLEVMPIGEFPGRFGWGYDGVDLFAPSHLYGSPDDLRYMVDRAHATGLGVILDVVYNHLGPDGNYLKEFAPYYFEGATEWGEALNFDGEGSGPVRELFVANAGYWIDEFHFDGLRLDATQQIFDESPRHVIAEVTARVRAAAKGRATIVVGENEPQQARLARPLEDGGYGLDALWNDDYHHCALVAVTGDDDAYYTGYRGIAQELLSCAKWGYLFQGEWYGWQEQRRGTPSLDLDPAALICFTENHDQVANSARGLRLHALTSPGRHRAITALTLLLPGTPMLFMGQEFAASSPFLYFADHDPALQKLVRKGRTDFLAQFPSIALPETGAQLADPGSPSTFARCKLDWDEWDEHHQTVALVRDLLRLRRDDPTISRQGHGGRFGPRGVDGAVLDRDAFVLRWFGAPRDGSGDRLLVVNLGRRQRLGTVAEPLLAPPEGRAWRLRWSSDAVAYGGDGTPEPDTDDGGWWLPAEAALVLAPVERAGAPPARRPNYSQNEKR